MLLSALYHWQPRKHNTVLEETATAKKYLAVSFKEKTPTYL